MAVPIGVSVRSALRPPVEATAVVHATAARPLPAGRRRPRPIGRRCRPPADTDTARGRAPIVVPTTNPNVFGALADRRRRGRGRGRRRRSGPVTVRPGGRGDPACRCPGCRALSAFGSSASAGTGEATSAAVPVTCGAAIDVPSSQPQPGVGMIGVGRQRAQDRLAGRDDVDGSSCRSSRTRPARRCCRRRRPTGCSAGRTTPAGSSTGPSSLSDAAVAGRGHEEHPRGPGSRRTARGASFGRPDAAPRGVGDPDPERLWRRRWPRSPSSRTRNPASSSPRNFRAMIETPGATPTTPDPVERRGDRPGDVRAMPVLVEVVDGVVVVAEVPAVDVVDVAVAVVVDAVGLLAVAALARVRPRPRGEVRMAEVDPVVDDRHDRAGRPGRDAERLAAVDVDVGRAAGAGVPCRMSWPVLSRPHSSSHSGSAVGSASRKRSWSMLDPQRRARRPAAWRASPPRSPGLARTPTDRAIGLPGVASVAPAARTLDRRLSAWTCPDGT